LLTPPHTRAFRSQQRSPRSEGAARGRDKTNEVDETGRRSSYSGGQMTGIDRGDASDNRIDAGKRR